MMIKKYSLLVLFIILNVGFSSTSLSQILAKEDITLYKDIVYTVVDGHQLNLDLAVPKYLKSPVPAIVDIQGGAWRRCEKSAEEAIFYAKYGFVGVSIEHRTSDVAIFPAAVHDCKTAIRWLRANSEKYKIDSNKVGVTGYSSGGHLAALLGTSGGDSYLEGRGGYPEYSSRVQAVVDHFGPTDFMKMNDTTGLGLKNFLDNFNDESPASLFLGGPLKEKADLARLANPITYIDKEDPPVFIGHGELDGMVIIKQSELLYEALKDAGVPTKLLRVKNADHMYRPASWDVEVSPTVREIYQMTIHWFEKWLGKPDIDVNAIPEKRNKDLSSGTYDLFYRLTIDLPGKTAKSNCKGNFRVLCEGKTLAEGEIDLDDLSTEKKRIFHQNLVLTGVELIGKEIMWNFRGEIFDSELNEKFEPMYMQGEKFDASIVGIGYHIYIDKDRDFKILKKIFRD